MLHVSYERDDTTHFIIFGSIHRRGYSSNKG